MAGDDDASELARGKAGPGKGFPPWLIAVIVVGIVSVLFIMQNRTRVKVHFIVFDRQARTWVVILISMALRRAPGRGGPAGRQAPRATRPRRRPDPT